MEKCLGCFRRGSDRIFFEEDKIFLRKYETDRTCAVTGEVLDENVEFTYEKCSCLSPRGAEILLRELQSFKFLSVS
ncbi:AbrB family transcriptional regulator [Alkalicoccus daliensis]|uniref:AbrB family transcriptional regulator n=1 Tax=Alkalicoccus daliensis TaxID=745820 RepID=UPI001FCD4461|nr:AbrB family transcriptional regulator [Alkalicoccus daliensis]